MLYITGCTKNKERVAKMLDLLIAAGLEGKPTLEKCKALKQAKLDKREQEKLARKEARAKHKDDDGNVIYYKILTKLLKIIVVL